MAKRRKVKPGIKLSILALVSFFTIYFGVFIFVSNKAEKSDQPVKTTSEQEEDTRSLMTQINSKKKIYVSDDDVSNIKIEEAYWDEIKVLMTEFSKVRKPGSYKEKYSGYSDDGVRFSTDLNYFRVYTVNKEEYYKVPVVTQKEFNKLLNESIYTSFEFVKKYKDWKNVKITYDEKTKTIHKWKYQDLSREMLLKRMVGKVQPEKSKERSKYNFTIDIQGEKFNIKVETMGKDYLKVSSGEAVSYYEVHTKLYEYIKSNIFKIK